MSEKEDITDRLQKMHEYLVAVGTTTILGINWQAALIEAKTEIERLRKYEDTIRMACRW